MLFARVDVMQRPALFQYLIRICHPVYVGAYVDAIELSERFDDLRRWIYVPLRDLQQS